MRLIVLGGGAVVSEFHLPALRQLGWVEKSVVVEQSKSRAEELQKAFPDLAIKQEEFRNFLSRRENFEGFDGALVALPNYLHEEATELALRAGLHVLCEKPLTLTQEGCLHLASVANSTNRILAVAMVMRFYPGVLALRDGLWKRFIGELISVDCEQGQPLIHWPSENDDCFRKENRGIGLNLGVHYLDLIQHLVGELSPISYTDDFAGGIELNSEYHLQTKEHVPVKVLLSWTHALRNTTVLKGTLGTVSLSNNPANRQVALENTNMTAQLSVKPRWRSGEGSKDPILSYAEQLVAFEEAVRGNGRPTVSAEEAASTIGICDWAYNQRSRKSSDEIGPQKDDRPKLEHARVVITGGTGFIGSKLTARLAKMGFDDIVVPTRSHRHAQNIGNLPVTLERVDLLDAPQVSKIMKGARYVFHLAYGSGPQAEKVTIGGTRNVVEAAIRSGAESVVVFSTATVFGSPPSDLPIDESWPYRPALGEYGRSKMKMEQYCLRRARSSHRTRIVILNLGSVYGPGSKLFTMLPVQSAKEGTFCWFNDGKGVVNYTFVENVVDAALLAATREEAAGQRFIITDGHCSWKEFFAPVLGPWVKNVPSYSVKALKKLHREQVRSTFKEICLVIARDRKIRTLIRNVSVLQATKRLIAQMAPGRYRRIVDLPHSNDENGLSDLDHRLRIPPLWLAKFFDPVSSHKFSSAKAQKLLGWRPRISLHEGQRIAVEWLKYVRLL